MSNVVIGALLGAFVAAGVAFVVWRMRGDVGASAGKLHFLTGPRQGETISIPPGRLRIGALSDNDLVLNMDGVSRYHAEIRTAGPRTLLWDLQATNGTFLNGKRISSSELASGDVIQIDTIEMRYEA